MIIKCMLIYQNKQIKIITYKRAFNPIIKKTYILKLAAVFSIIVSI